MVQVSLLIFALMMKVSYAISCGFGNNGVGCSGMGAVSVTSFPVGSSCICTPLNAGFGRSLGSVFLHRAHLGLIGGGTSLRVSKRVAKCGRCGRTISTSKCSSRAGLAVAIGIHFIGGAGRRRSFRRRFSTFHICSSERLLATIRSKLVTRVAGRVASRVFGTAMTG